MDPGGGEWRLVREEARPGATNMALDAVAAETAAAGGPRTIRVYRWEPSALSLGYAQPSSTVDWDHCARTDVDVVRRPTGGGGIYHDAFGDISYAVAVPADDVPGDLLSAYSLLLAPVLEGLSRMGVEAGFAPEERPALYEPACYLRAVEPAHDVVAGGRKISGNAQHRRRGAVLQHGSITYRLDAERHLAAFADPGVTPAEVEARVTSVRAESGIDRAAAVEAIEEAFAEWAGAEPGDWTTDELERAEEMARDRFASDDWTRRR